MGQVTANRKQRTGGLRLVRKPFARQEVGLQVVREGSTGRVVTTMPLSPLPVVPRIWAVAEVGEGVSGALEEAAESPVRESGSEAPDPLPEVAFYRKYTEAMLRRYMRLSMEAGRVPSLMGRELFRGHVTSYKVKSFEDVVIFCHDVEKCLKVLDARERELIKRIALQAYSHGEAAGILGLSLRSCIRYYFAALDKLTRELLELELLRPLESCQ